MRRAEKLFKALGDVTRLRIMAILIDGKEYCVCDFMEVLGLPQSTVSRHLAYLKNSGWLNDRRENRWNYYRLKGDPEKPEDDLIEALRASLTLTSEAKEDRIKMAAYLKRKKANACS